MKPPHARLAAALALALAGCVSTPEPEEVLATGFRTPEMTFHTLQVGVRADLPGLEYACLSGDFRARYGLSQLAYREFREDVLEHEIAFWLGIPKAEVLETVVLAEDRRLLRCESHGTPFELELVREDYWQLWEGQELIADELLPPGSFPERAEVFSEAPGVTMVSGFAQLPTYLDHLPPEELNRRFTEFRIGREWKIDRIAGLAEPGP
jgi:hypothetical protein